ncbi:hypothetical protein H6G33_20365 [Calothrix sp. FACHB-1219]|uniref:hypothetical protein n=1 Tax=unclassified Calothrix TaxID=2619626 RepID=UPI001686E391|nr:hypothetical protein [Calothrix sp. FACHB-168]MBD2204580.1 hypothetical protein [Calothrix sp. FACHB-168]MBD2219378.1 hypothetical protein [Calothrix sp. FACHB-1219]
MLVVVASRHDKAAEALVANWAADGVSLLTPEDLSVVGWRQYLNSPADSQAVVGERAIALDQITGVLSRLPTILPQELLHIVPEDRVYVAGEMNAFLIAWLSSLNCPVLNRPTPTYLLGPAWRLEQWAYAAAQLGIAVRPVRRQSSLLSHVNSQVSEPAGVQVIVVGDRCLGDVDNQLKVYARRLADAAQVDLLTVSFSSREASAEFVGADLWTDISIPDVSDAIFKYLSGGDRKC